MKKIFVTLLATSLLQLAACGTGTTTIKPLHPAQNTPAESKPEDNYLPKVVVPTQASTDLVDCLCGQVKLPQQDADGQTVATTCEAEPTYFDGQQVQLRLTVESSNHEYLDSHVIYLAAPTTSPWTQAANGAYFSDKAERSALVVSQSDDSLYRQVDVSLCVKYLQ